MKECFVEGETLPEAYHKALWTLQNYGEENDCIDWNCKQKECSMTMVVNNPLAENRISRLCISYPEALEQYKEEMLDGIMDFEIEKGNWKYTYHDRMSHYTLFDKSEDGIYLPYHRDQVDFVMEELIRNPSSRRAVIDVRDNSSDMGSNDPACLQHIQYFIRDNKLDCKVLFRSNDATRATFMNAFALIELQKIIAEEVGVEVGKYVHRANSFHCYESEFNMLASYANAIENKPIEELTYSYEDNWKEEMEASKDFINEKVEALKCQ